MEVIWPIINEFQCIRMYPTLHAWHVICDRILENSSKSHIKSDVFLHIFNDISIYA